MVRYLYKYNRTLVPFSRLNKKEQPEAEKVLRRKIRNRQLSKYKFIRQYPINNFVLDFYCVEVKLAVEVDGGQHMDSLYDKQRDSVLKNLSIKVIRFWDNEVLDNIDEVLEKILFELQSLSKTTSS